MDGGRLGTKYIAADSNIAKYRAFEDAVVELQAGKQRDLTDTYNTAVQKPLKPLVTAFAPEKIGTRLSMKNCAVQQCIRHAQHFNSYCQPLCFY